MSLLFDIAKAYALGVIAFAAVPIFTRPLSWERKQGLIQTYTGMAIGIIGRGLLIWRSHGGWKLKRTKYDTLLDGEACQLGGERKHWTDPDRLFGSLQGRRFGIAHESRNVILNARICALARRFRELHRQNEWTQEHAGRVYRKAHFAIDAGRELVNPSDALPIIQEQADPALADTVEEYVEKGQKGFNSTRLAQGMSFAVAFGVPFGLMWLATEVISKTGGTTQTLPV